VPDTAPLLVRRDGAIATLTFNRPTALNALDPAMARLLAESSEALRRDSGLRAVLLTGEGRAFMAGGDIAVLASNPGPATADTLILNLHRGLANLAGLAAPVVAVCQGAVAGAGFSIAMAADFVIAAEDARFTTAYAKIGASLDGSSSWTLPRLVGYRKAMELALLSPVLDAAEALRLGLVTKVVPAERLQAEAHTLASTLAAGPTHAYGRMKALLRAAHQNGLAEQLELERLLFGAGAATADFAEGTAAFLAKRQATFQGR
jgi:2-(1,2-epoxy-1,2-dihydrophenyl)acetyl-CoA isomerase